jgi:O-antigen/teichoic acid export membrane protein
VFAVTAFLYTVFFFVERRCIDVPKLLLVLRGFLTCTFVVAVLIVQQGISRGWEELSESSYWIKKGIVFGIVAVAYGVSAAIWGSRVMNPLSPFPSPSESKSGPEVEPGDSHVKSGLK